MEAPAPTRLSITDTQARLTLAAHLVYDSQRMAAFEGDFVGLI